MTIFQNGQSVVISNKSRMDREFQGWSGVAMGYTSNGYLRVLLSDGPETTVLVHPESVEVL